MSSPVVMMFLLLFGATAGGAARPGLFGTALPVELTADNRVQPEVKEVAPVSSKPSEVTPPDITGPSLEAPIAPGVLLGLGIRSPPPPPPPSPPPPSPEPPSPPPPS
ncbi:hypothetical protein Vafri_5876, partial [Volvox africanus]